MCSSVGVVVLIYLVGEAHEVEHLVLDCPLCELAEDWEEGYGAVGIREQGVQSFAFVEWEKLANFPFWNEFRVQD